MDILRHHWNCEVTAAAIINFEIIRIWGKMCKCLERVECLIEFQLNFVLFNRVLEVVISLFFAFFITTSVSQDRSPALIEAPLGCHRKQFTHPVSQNDSKGYFCSDIVSVYACAGQCESKEIGDYKFPFKHTFHPVCVHSGRTKVIAMLRNCDPLASMEARRYEYMEAIGCSCQTCSSSDTACESPQFKGTQIVQIMSVAGDEVEQDYN